jgi:uncharacterized RDD family membrane protein YckC
MKVGLVREYAGFSSRTAAFVLDYALILGYLLGLTLLLFLLNSLFGVNQWLFANRVRAQLVAFLLVTLPVALYFAISESSAQRATRGKRRLGLKVVDQNGARIRLPRALGRTLLKFIPWELSHTLIWQISFSPGADSVWISYGFLLVYGLIGLNIASLFMTRQHQTLYDLIAKTYVIRSR